MPNAFPLEVWAGTGHGSLEEGRREPDDTRIVRSRRIVADSIVLRLATRQLVVASRVVCTESRALLTRLPRAVKGGSDDVKARIRWKIISGALPRLDRVSAWHGHGTSRVCSACDATICPEQVEVEIDSTSSPLLLHLACFHVWLAEYKFVPPPATGPSAASGQLGV
jgi:hypothetical protein